MEIFLLAVLLGLMPAVIAQGKGRSFGLWWLYGTVLFIVALPHSLIMRADSRAIERKQLSSGMKKCQFCAELIKREAVVCRYCGRATVNDEQLMKEFGVTFDGERYCFEGYHYDDLSDAVGYAKLQSTQRS